MKQVYKWFHDHTNTLLTLLVLSLAGNIGFGVFFMKEKTQQALIIKPTALSFDDTKQHLPLTFDEPVKQYISDAIEQGRDTVFTHVSLNNAVLQSFLEKSTISLVASEKIQYVLGQCYATPPASLPNFYRVRVSLIGKSDSVLAKNLILNDSEYFPRCFRTTKDSTFLFGYVPLTPDGKLKFTALIHARKIGAPYKFRVQLFGKDGKLVAKYPIDKAFETGTIPSLGRNVPISGTLTLQQSTPPQSTTPISTATLNL